MMRMLGIDSKAARYTWTAAAVILLLALVYIVRKTLFIFVLAVLFAYLLSPLVNLLDHLLPSSKRRTPLLAHYMRALVLLSAAAFTAYSIFFTIMGVPYGVLLAALGGMLEFIPMLGPLAAGVLIVLVSALSGSHAVAVLIFLLAYRVFQD